MVDAVYESYLVQQKTAFPSSAVLITFPKQQYLPVLLAPGQIVQLQSPTRTGNLQIQSLFFHNSRTEVIPHVLPQQPIPIQPIYFLYMDRSSRIHWVQHSYVGVGEFFRVQAYSGVIPSVGVHTLQGLPIQVNQPCPTLLEHYLTVQ